MLWVFSRSACAPQLSVYLCASHPSESLNSCLQDRVDRVCIPNHHRDLQKDGPCHHQSQQMEKGQVSLTLIGWEDGVRNPHGWTEMLQRKPDIRCRSILLMKPALSWLSSFSLEASLILSWNRSFFSVISFLYFPWYVLLLSAC